MATKKKTEKAPEPAKMPERSVKCGNCGTENEFGAIVCAKCGYNRLNVTVREGDRVQEYH
jgi:ribosomal protein L40E